MHYSVRMTERDSVLGTIVPFAGTAGTYLTPAIDLVASKCRRITFYVIEGAIGTNVNFSVTWSAVSGSGYAAYNSAAIVQDTTGSNVHQVEILIENLLNANPTALFLKGSLVIGATATPCAVLVIGSDAWIEPVSHPGAGTNPQIVVS